MIIVDDSKGGAYVALPEPEPDVLTEEQEGMPLDTIEGKDD
jgi:hypothetical protein